MRSDSTNNPWMDPPDPAGSHPLDTYQIAMIQVVASDAVDTLDLPHIVHVSDPYLDVPLVFGPFAAPVDAIVFADTYRRDLSYLGCETEPTITVIPLRPQ